MSLFNIILSSSKFKQFILAINASRQHTGSEDNSSLSLICRGVLLSSWEQLNLLLPTQQLWDRAMRRALDQIKSDKDYEAVHEAQEKRSAFIPDLSRVSVCQHATPTTT